MTANLHGDECTGFATAIHLLESLKSTLLRGKVVIYPSLNPLGLIQHRREHPRDGKDMNRLFPGRMMGGIAERHVYHVWNSILKHTPDVILDLHTDSGDAIPYVLIDRVLRGRKKGLEHEMLAMARSSNLTCIHEYTTTLYRHYKLEKSLSGTGLNTLGCPTLTLEVGPRRRIDKAAVDIMTSAVRGILHYLGLIAQKPITINTPLEGNWYRSNGPYIQQSGIFVPSCHAGTILEANTELGVLYSTQGEILQRITTSQRSLVLSLANQCFIREKGSCAALALPEERVV